MPLDQVPQGSPPFVFLRSEDDEMSVCPITDSRNQVDYVKTPDELRGKRILNSYYGWFVLINDDLQYSLWNPLTLESVAFPRLDLQEQKVYNCILTSPPSMAGSMLVLFEERGPSLIGCKIGYEQWTRSLIVKEDFMDDHRFDTPVMCNGILYALTSMRIVQIDLCMSQQSLLSMVADFSLIQHDVVGYRYGRAHLIESFGELSVVFIYYSGKSSRAEAIDARVLKLDSSKMELKNVESFKGQAIFIGGYCSAAYSCPTTGSKLKSNHIYFTWRDNKCIYSINMDDKIVSLSLPHPKFPNLMHQPIWIMGDSLRVIIGQSKGRDLYDVEKERKWEDNRKLVKHLALQEEVGGGNFSKLPSDLLYIIGRRLILGDYISFRSVNKKCWLACPPIQWTSAILKEFEGDVGGIPPWFTFWRKGDEYCNCLDIWHGEQYLISIPDNALRDVVMCHSSFGWCVMLKGKRSIFLWNPLTKETIFLPELRCPSSGIIGCALSPKIDKVVLIHYLNQTCMVEYIFFENEEWLFTPYLDLKDFEVGMDKNLIYYNDRSYLFDVDGNMMVLRLLEFEELISRVLELEEEIEGGLDNLSSIILVDKVTTPCSDAHESYLMESDGKLLSIFVGLWGERVQIFTLDSKEKHWVEIETLGNKTIFISRFSCYSTTLPTLEIGERVYFSRYHGEDNDIIYYSLVTKKFHTHGKEEILENFDNTKKHLFPSCWFALTF